MCGIPLRSCGFLDRGVHEHHIEGGLAARDHCFDHPRLSSEGTTEAMFSLWSHRRALSLRDEVAVGPAGTALDWDFLVLVGARVREDRVSLMELM